MNAEPLRHWPEYRPERDGAWDSSAIVHLYRRVAFSPTWTEIERAQAEGLDATLERFRAGSAFEADAGFDARIPRIARAAVASGRLERLQAVWILRMLRGSDPLGERLTMHWHDHFATSIRGVNRLDWMARHVDSLRELAREPFFRLVACMLRDPALLVWLDAPENQAGGPNENLARELLELFTLGLGAYRQQDVRQAAKALTGWWLDDRGHLVWREDRHEPGSQTILGATRDFSLDELAEHLLAHPATARHLASKLWRWTLGERPPEEEALAELAAHLEANELSLPAALDVVLRSQRFFAAHGGRVASPVENVVGRVRALERAPTMHALALADWCGRMEHRLYDPPNVGGWAGGRAWLGTPRLLSEANFVHSLVEDPEFDPIELAESHGARELADQLTHFATLLLGLPWSERWEECLHTELGRRARREPGDLRRALRILGTSPEAFTA